MPIRPENHDRYPADWADISRRIRFARALGRCECEGECGLKHTGRCEARHNAPNPRTGTKVVLTVAHLDHIPEHCDDANLKAMCNGCHLHYDRDHHKETAARTKAAEVATWNTPLPGLETGEPEFKPLPAARFYDGIDMSRHTAMLSVRPNTPEQRIDAACYVASRARALGWSRDQHETVMLALFQPPRRAHERVLDTPGTDDGEDTP